MLIRSSVEGIGWPALVNGHAAQYASLLFQLEKSQWWPADRLEFVQRQQLALLLAHACKTVPYYREIFGANANPVELCDAWGELPVLTRSSIQLAQEALFSESPPKAHGKIYKVQTSGSTGQPVELLGTALNRLMFQTFTLRDHLWHQRAFHETFASIRPDRESEPDGTTKPNWGEPAATLYETGPAMLLHSSTPIEKQVEWLEAAQPGYLISMPTNLLALAKHFMQSRKRLQSLLQVLSYGETLSANVRNNIQNAFGVSIADLYSTVEVGYIALQCPEGSHYHVQAESVYVEVLTDDGRNCGPGETGRIVVTPLHQFASPLIRYELGDYVEVGQPCACGRGLPVINRILGRKRNLITLPDGSRHWPSFPEEAWMHVAPIRQLQLAQTGLRHIEVRLVMDRQMNQGEQLLMAEILARCLRHSFQFSFTYHASLFRGRNRKFEDFVSEIDTSSPR